MPLALDPNSSVWLSVESDMSKPESERPAFQVRILSMRQQLDLQEEIKRKDEVCTQLAKYVIGWRNMGRDFIPGDAEQFMDIFDRDEAAELMAGIFHAGMLSKIQKKRSELQVLSDGESSVKTAESIVETVGS